MTDKKLHRLHLSIEEDIYFDFRDTIQWGLRNALIVAVLKIIIAAVKQDGMMIVGAVLAGKYKLVIDNGDKQCHD